MPFKRAHAAPERPHKTRAEVSENQKSAVTDCSSCSTLKTIQSATAIITKSNIARGGGVSDNTLFQRILTTSLVGRNGGVSTWPEAVRTWPEAVRTWPKAVHILVVGRLGR